MKTYIMLILMLAGKEVQKKALDFTQNLEANLVKIQEELKQEIVDYPKYKVFYIYEPKNLY